MKKVILLMLLLWTLLTLNSYGKLYNKKQLVDKTIETVSKELCIDSSATILVCFVMPSDLENLDIKGLTTQYPDNIFVININPNVVFKEDLIEVLIHELIHVSQCTDKKMVIHKNFVWYEGTTYTYTTPNKDRPYEVQAMELTEKLYNKYAKEIKNYDTKN